MDKFKEIINSFFEEENISDKFESNFNNRVTGFANFTCSSVDQYINQINNNECFDMFFLFAFNWSRSVEGDSFWLDIAKLCYDFFPYLVSFNLFIIPLSKSNISHFLAIIVIKL